MWTSNRRTRATSPIRARQTGIALAALACVGLAACTAPEAPAPASSTEARTATPLPESGELDTGTYLVTGFTVPFEITVPAAGSPAAGSFTRTSLTKWRSP